MLAQDSSKASFLARLPRDLAAGKVVIRHSSVAESGPFEVFASYDVLERRTSQDASASTASRVPQRTAVYVRHFDVDGNERKLPQERRSPSGNFPSEKPPPPGAGAAK